ncbi:MAG TPA: hotdog fold thioesterase [Candidatus Pseudogracilibacillus intestinigallinarum]|uniref:Hotdog fold thioesterase n=1 Tax=Candidatus Pseudogracilibacillus intestinigallinarum TaxID=2838742 RepID=A0A9D1PLI6_9BACI|nr:hotdog fold thioesterase [Candidatus Pseudogracilibacillus intestinigallinarum]
MFKENKLMEALGIEIVTLEKNRVVMTMPVDERTHQPAGYLHGGASVLLAETAASIGGFLNVNEEEEAVFGVEINANHLKSKREGVVTATATPIHIGRTTQVWNIDIRDEQDAKICISRCTIGVVKRRK